MPGKLPPSPVGIPPGHSFWNDWYEKLRLIVNTAGAVWTQIDFSSSNLTDIVTRSHQVLQSLQGGASGEYNHLDNTDYTALSGARVTKGTDTTDDLIVDDATKGLVLKDTQGTPHYWRITVDNTGVLVISDLGTTKP